jgi:hypothetical protein
MQVAQDMPMRNAAEVGNLQRMLLGALNGRRCTGMQHVNQPLQLLR